ncbi:MAG: hypothetical protein ACOCRX_09510 [Candidatus Woesearchaeota archaeon]
MHTSKIERFEKLFGEDKYSVKIIVCTTGKKPVKKTIKKILEEEKNKENKNFFKILRK